MSSPARRAARALGPGTVAVGGWLVALADPAAAHDAGGGSLPAPPWLLAYPAPRRPARLGPPRRPCAPAEDLPAPRAAVSVAAAVLLVLG